jgi:hypothetical protein
MRSIARTLTPSPRVDRLTHLIAHLAGGIGLAPRSAQTSENLRQRPTSWRAWGNPNRIDRPAQGLQILGDVRGAFERVSTDQVHQLIYSSHTGQYEQ